MERFFVPQEWIKQNRVSLIGETAHQVVNVLRLKSKEHVIVLDNSGLEYEVEIEQASGNLVQGTVVDKRPCPGEPGIRITLYQAILKMDKLELVLQKGVELGVSVFVPFVSERCVVRAPSERKIHRWQTIVREAAEQSGRAMLPVIRPVTTFRDACVTTGQPAILLWEEEKRQLHTVLRSAPFNKAQTISVFIGPEGGFPSSEAAFAESHGIIPVILGKRVLRAETAGITAISVILYERGELG